MKIAQEQNVYSKIKLANNPSPWTQEFFKFNMKQGSWARLWISAPTIKELNRLKNKFRGHHLWIGFPDDNLGKTGVVRQTLFNGVRLSDVYCRKTSKNPNVLMRGSFIDLKNKYWLDVTDLFIDRYNSIGKCLLHDSDHKFIKVDKKTRVCRVCGFKEKLVKKISYEWKSVANK